MPDVIVLTCALALSAVVRGQSELLGIR